MGTQFRTKYRMRNRRVSGMNGRTLLQPSDFTYEGAFLLPKTATSGYGTEGITTSWGLAIRQISGAPMLYICCHQLDNGSATTGTMFEFRVPTLDTGATVTSTATLAAWNDISRDGTDTPTCWWDANNALLTGHKPLLWNPTDSRMYYFTPTMYNGDWKGLMPVVGYATLNDGTKVGTGYGAWRLPSTDSNGKCVSSRICFQGSIIPQWFADAYLGGRYLALGFGGTASVATNGPISYGLALVAINPATSIDLVSAAAARPSDPNDESTYDGMPAKSSLLLLSNRPFGVGGVSAMCRDTDYHSHYTGDINPSSGVGYFTGNDWFEQMGTVWIDTGSKHGLVTFGNVVSGTGETTIAADPAPTSTSVTLTGACPNLSTGNVVAIGTDALFYIDKDNSTVAVDDAPNGVIAGLVTSISTGNGIGFTPLSYGSDTYGWLTPTAGHPFYRGVFYSMSHVYSTWQKLTFFMHDPADLAAVAQGSKDAYAVEASWWDDIGTDIPFLPANLEKNQGYVPQGICYDNVNQKVYVFFPAAYPYGAGSPSPVVVRYAVS